MRPLEPEMTDLSIHDPNIDAIPSALNFTDSAAKKVHELIMEEDNPKLMLRVFITGGGCSGFQYGFTFEDHQNDDDMVIEKEVEDDDGGEGGEGGTTVKLLVDPM